MKNTLSPRFLLGIVPRKFRSLTLRQQLCVVVIVKLFIMFAVLKLFFFPDFIGTHATAGNEAGFVSGELLNRKAP